MFKFRNRSPHRHEFRLWLIGVVGLEGFPELQQPVDKLQSPADCQRRLYRETGSWKALTDEMVRKLSDELDSASG